MSITPFFHVYHKYVFNMANISKIKISGTSYSIKDENACNVVELTQAQYDDLPTSAKTSNSLFVITDATAGDLSNYYTKTETDGLLDTKLDVTAYTPTDLSNYYTKSETSGATEISTALASKADTATTYTKIETDNAITAATSTKQDTLVSGTNIKTINNQSILGEGNIDIQGGGEMDGNTQQLISTALVDINDRKIDASEVKANYQKKGDYATKTELGAKANASEVMTLEESTKNEHVTASALVNLNNKFGGLSLVKITESAYSALTTKDENTLYIVVSD